MERNLERVHLIRWENLSEKIQRKCRDFSFYRIPRLLIKNLMGIKKKVIDKTFIVDTIKLSIMRAVFYYTIRKNI